MAKVLSLDSIILAEATDQAICSLFPRDSIALAGHRFAGQDASGGHNVSMVGNIAAMNLGWRQTQAYPFSADVGGEPAIELATGCCVRRHQCANDCLEHWPRRWDAWTAMITIAAIGRSRATDSIESRSVVCAWPSRENAGERDTVDILRQIIGPRRQQGHPLPPVRPISIPRGPRRRQSEHADQAFAREMTGRETRTIPSRTPSLPRRVRSNRQ
ncbi:hypothetical protein SAMN05444164_6999 [Bradyrhizobium erythrophlei]|uniref:Uncharacterized protein n=1 Tax=Bradyrhizobium erythrophlei TaxID=1437360 RepID=A0A1H5GA96_9BRAD|nr:hypothetical protein SAMN05444164_6999 [Bradyrhizobium erythrophlei]